MSRRTVDVDAYVDGVRAGNRTYLGRAITLVESTNREHQELAQQMLLRLLPHAGDSHRVGITGVPGSGKSTFIDALGTKLTGQGHRVAVLAIDPTSSRTRWQHPRRQDAHAAPVGRRVGLHPPVADRRARSAASPERPARRIVVCEAAGFDVVLVETVGVGQSETLVAKMVDFFLVLMIPGAGDELQGIKKGVLELADMIAVNKADGDNEGRARVAANDYSSALRLMQPSSPSWSPPVVTCSALHEIGLDTLWAQIELHRAKLSASGELDDKRRQQQVDWMWASVEDRLLSRLHHAPGVKRLVPRLEREVREGTLTATLAAQRILDALEQ